MLKTNEKIGHLVFDSIIRCNDNRETINRPTRAIWWDLRPIMKFIPSVQMGKKLLHYGFYKKHLVLRQLDQKMELKRIVKLSISHGKYFRLIN